MSGRERAHAGLIFFPPAVIVNTVVPLSTLPEPLVTPGKTVSWPPFTNDEVLTSLSVTESLPGVYVTVKPSIGLRTRTGRLLTALIVTVSSS